MLPFTLHISIHGAHQDTPLVPSLTNPITHGDIPMFSLVIIQSYRYNMNHVIYIISYYKTHKR